MTYGIKNKLILLQVDWTQLHHRSWPSTRLRQNDLKYTDWLHQVGKISWEKTFWDVRRWRYVNAQAFSFQLASLITKLQWSFLDWDYWKFNVHSSLSSVCVLHNYQHIPLGIYCWLSGYMKLSFNTKLVCYRACSYLVTKVSKLLGLLGSPVSSIVLENILLPFQQKGDFLLPVQT